MYFLAMLKCSHLHFFTIFAYNAVINNFVDYVDSARHSSSGRRQTMVGWEHKLFSS